MPLGRKKEFIGYVTSNSMDKTVVVQCEKIYTHSFYKKVVKKYAKFMAENPKNIAKAGDKVKIIETRPISKNKRWYVAEIIEKAKVVGDTNDSDANYARGSR